MVWLELQWKGHQLFYFWRQRKNLCEEWNGDQVCQVQFPVDIMLEIFLNVDEDLSMIKKRVQSSLWWSSLFASHLVLGPKAF